MSLAVAGLLLTASHAVGESSSPVSSVAGGHAVQCLPKRVAPDLFVGPTPDNSAFAWLAGQGVHTVVSVDGARPDVELAAKHGLRYVHVPFGYDGVPREAALALTRVAREASGGVYVHCHHGKQRGPAAAAIVGRARGVLTTDAAVRRLLASAGTDRRYAALWRDAAAYRPPADDEPLPELVAVAEVDPFAAAMAAVGRAWSRVGEDASDSEAGLLLYEAMRESARAAGPRAVGDDRFRGWLDEAVAGAEPLARLGEGRDAAARRASLEFSCQRCHTRYRD